MEEVFTDVSEGTSNLPFRPRIEISSLPGHERDEAQRLFMRVREEHWPAIESRVVASLSKEMAKLTSRNLTLDLQRRAENVFLKK